MLVLLPGLDGTGELFEPFLHALDGQDARVIRYPDRAMDYAGHEEFARSHLPVDRDYVLLAESFSGPVGISIAASPPARLRGLVLCATFASNPLPALGSFGKLIGMAMSATAGAVSVAMGTPSHAASRRPARATHI